MKTKELNWISLDGIEIYGKLWQPEVPLHGVICLIHGMGEHSDRYEHLAQYYTDKGFAVYTYDHRGHGKSGGKRGHSPSYDALLDGITDLLNRTAETFPETPVFLYGHSMGGNLVLNYAIRRQPKVKGVIVTGPWLKLAFEPPAIQLAVGKLVRSLLPGFTQGSKLDTSALSRDPEVVRRYEKDPLVHDRISTAMFFGVHDAGLYALNHAGKLKLPTLVMHGTEDKLTSAEGTKEFANNAGDNVTLKLWEGFYHEIHNEPEQGEVFDYTLNWMEQQL